MNKTDNKGILRNLFRKPFILLNWIFALLLLFSYVSVHLSPETIPGIAVLGLLYPFLIFINLFFLIFFVFRKKKFFLISFITIIIGFNHFTDFVSFNLLKDKVSDKTSIKILSYNVRMFDLYKWSDVPFTRNKMLRLLKNEDADIYCFQEFHSNNNKPDNNLDTILKLQKTKNYILSYKTKSNKSLGTGIFSKFPILNSGNIELNNKNKKCIYADIIIYKDTVRIYNIHLASVHLGYNDYNFVENITEKDNADKFKGIGGIFSKLMQGFNKRAVEVDAVSAHIKNSPYKVIVCGDFNDVPVSYTYRKIRGGLKDAFSETSFGTGSTYAGSIPLFRIDFMLHSPSIIPKNFDVIKEPYSDHYPIVCDFMLTP